MADSERRPAYAVSFISLFLYAYHKSKRRLFSYAEDLQVGVVLFPFLLGLTWPITLVSMLCIVLFKIVLEKPYNKFINLLIKLITESDKHLCADICETEMTTALVWA